MVIPKDLENVCHGFCFMFLILQQIAIEITSITIDHDSS